MKSIRVESLRFDFPEGWQAEKYDESDFFKNQFQRIQGTKAVDIFAVDPKSCTWLIEVKDYRTHQRGKDEALPNEIALKMRDTLAGLAAAQVNATDDHEKNAAKHALECRKFRVVLHLEQPCKHSKLFPRAFDPANVTQELKQRLKPIDPHPLVLEKSRMRPVAWKVH